MLDQGQEVIIYSKGRLDLSYERRSVTFGGIKSQSHALIIFTLARMVIGDEKFATKVLMCPFPGKCKTAKKKDFGYVQTIFV